MKIGSTIARAKRYLNRRENINKKIKQKQENANRKM
jgi:hypothetical protein